ncbi:hypothetical protein ACHAO8_010203 [Botrytis cinerea]
MAYDNPGGIIAAAVILELLAISFVTLRFLSNHRKGINNTATDWLILAALICSTGLTVIQIYGISQHALAYPLGGTLDDAKAITGRLNKAKHIELSFLLLGIFTLGLIKMSVTFLYWRIFSSNPVFRAVLITWLVIIACWTTAFVLAGLLECGSHLLALFSTPTAYLQHCGSAIPSGWANVGSDVGTDFITLLIPLPMIWSLRMPLHRKLLVVATFMLGLLSVGASIGKAYIYITASLGYYKSDAILTLTGISVWNLIEVQIGILAACGPTIRPILSDLLPTTSLISLLDSLRNGLSSRNTEPSSVEAANGNNYVKTVSDENLVPNHVYMGRAEIQGNEMELQPHEGDGIHVKQGVTVETV